jgi:acetyltransferase-like isoleucine patch superfamily enzyme
MHSNVHIGQLSQVDNFVWIYPYVVLTNDPTPPSNNFVGVHVHPFAIVATGAIVMPGLDLGQDCLIGAGAIVTRSVMPYAVAVGNPAKVVSDVRKTKNKITGEPAYPWREHFSNYMPWDGIGFDKWYASLDEEEKKALGIDNLR